MNLNSKILLAKLERIKGKLYNSDFLLTWDQPMEVIEAVSFLATALKKLHARQVDLRVFNSGIAVSQFRDNSTRTRFSFGGASDLLGLQVQDLDESKSQIAHGETVRETATMISFLAQIIGIRDDMFIGEGHEYMKEVGESLDESFQEKVLPQRPAVINLQCDRDHPTQSMADLSHLINYIGGIDNLKNKKIAMTWAYSPSYGKPLSVAQGITGLLSRFGTQLVLAHPSGYELTEAAVARAEKQAIASGGSFKVTDNMAEAFTDADIVYPKSWAPMSVMHERTRLLRARDHAGLDKLEKHALELNRQHLDWECNSRLMSRTSGGEALYMHCLPADISGVSCEKGEVSAEVFAKYRLQTYHEASYKPFVIAAMAMLTRFENPAGIMEKFAHELK
ncbi:MAG: knotted carbamoyltransferase YgeW [Deltaproteobacteria bacterium]|jgi:knotted carbamoyltransferase YgeW|nr:knotted carbamoyltransferase YgeW [Deltaproteobacteria bacterium]